MRRGHDRLDDARRELGFEQFCVRVKSMKEVKSFVDCQIAIE
jgi:hypothetical protein